MNGDSMSSTCYPAAHKCKTAEQTIDSNGISKVEIEKGHTILFRARFAKGGKVADCTLQPRVRSMQLPQFLSGDRTSVLLEVRRQQTAELLAKKPFRVKVYRLELGERNHGTNAKCT